MEPDTDAPDQGTPSEGLSDPKPTVPDWTPLYDKVIVQRLPEVTELRGLAVPERHRKAQTVGIVVRVGNGRWINGVLYPLTVTEGSYVLFSSYAGSPIEGQDDVLVLREDEILAWRE